MARHRPRRSPRRPSAEARLAGQDAASSEIQPLEPEGMGGYGVDPDSPIRHEPVEP